MRDHIEEKDFDNRGIFKELVNFRAELDRILRQQLQQSSNFYFKHMFKTKTHTRVEHHAPPLTYF